MFRRDPRRSPSRRLRPAVLRRAVRCPLLHRLAVVRRGRLPADLLDDAARPEHAVHDRVRRRVRLDGRQPARRAGLDRRRAAGVHHARGHRGHAARPPAAAHDRHGGRRRHRRAGRAVRLGRWEIWLAWRNAVPFGVADPILGHDVGFYVFSLPFLQLLTGLGQALVVLAALDRRRAVPRDRQPDVRLPRPAGAGAGGAPAPVAAGRGVAAAAGVRRLAAAGRAPDRAVGADSGRQLRRRARPDAGGAGADGGGGRRRRPGAVAGVHAAQLADAGRGRPLRAGRRSAARSTARCCSSSSSRPTSRRARRRSSSTTSTPRGGRSASTRSRNASCPATRS